MDECNGRQDSEAPSSSSSDFYNVDAQTTRPSMAAPEALLPQSQHDGPLNMAHDHHDADDEDSSSEMDVSASSRASSAEPDTQPSQHAGTKRTLSSAANGHTPTAEQDSAKRPRLSIPPVQRVAAQSRGAAALPVELWQQVFLCLPPAMLCRCLRVCREFNKYLTNIKAAPAAKKDLPKVRVLDSEAIWTHARKTFFPNLPRPLLRCSELEMLQLVGGQTCQFCTRAPIPSPATTPFNCGPGPDGLRVIWPFGIRACGRCIENNTAKDIAVLVQPVSALRLGMSYAFLTPDLNIIPDMQRQAPSGIPAHLRAAKIYYGKDIETISSDYETAKSFGEGAADEWRKGLQTMGKEAMADASRWEKWEAQMRLGSDLSQVLREYDPSSFSRRVEETPSRSAGVNGSQQALMPNGTHALPQPVQALSDGYGTPFQFFASQVQHAHKSVRDATEVEAIRQARRLDIERRCMELEPPLEPNVLYHVSSFTAALMIPRQMTDDEWEKLKPRILAQREDAELAEHSRQEQWAALNSTTGPTATEEAYIKPAKELYDKEYEHSQEPLRKKLGDYAAEYINDRWNERQTLNKDTCPVFAVETMLHVREKYYQAKAAGALPAYEPPAKAGSKSGTPIPEPFLSLDNMKWVYDNKIKPLTENGPRELFICAGCAEERRPKWFAFEGLVQHYAAKHTTAFSKGNIVVHWQTSEWPNDPPFHRDPAHFIKADRRTSDFKARTRNTPQTTHDGPFAPPASGKLLSENPFFSTHLAQSSQQLSNGHHSAAGHSFSHHGHGSPYTSPQGYRHPSAAASEPRIDMSEHAQVSRLSSDAREIWDALECVKEMLECVRIKAVIHHVVTRFSEQFRQKPSLDLVTDALATNALIRPIKNAQGLACKFCVASQTDGSASYQSYFARIRNVKLYNTSSLITHFKIVHQSQGNAAGSLDWTNDMIELPETQIVSDLMRTPGMDDDKLAIVAGAFPRAFPLPLPKIGLVEEPPQELGPDSGLASRLLDRMNKKPKRQPRRSAGNGTSTPGRDGSHEPLPEANEDEYDPRRPMYVLPDGQGADPSRFDTDIARKASAGPSPSTPQVLNLAPETLAALNNLSVLTSQSQKPQADDRGDRSPSVGRDESPSSLSKPTNGITNVQPDISAILASLTGSAQPAPAATPPATISNRSDSAPKYPPADPYGPPHGASPRTYQEERRAPARYAAHPSHHRVSVEPVPRFDNQEIYATALRNAENFEHNRARTYAEPVYQQSAGSPPRYQYINGDGQHYTQAPQQPAPVYHDQQVRYVQLPAEYDRPQVQPYQYERAAPKPMYIDEYGRRVELIPVDSAPAPVQYLPHPFEQQQRPQQQQQQQQHYARVVEQTPAAHPHVAQPAYYEYAGPPHTGRGAQGMY